MKTNKLFAIGSFFLLIVSGYGSYFLLGNNKTELENSIKEKNWNGNNSIDLDSLFIQKLESCYNEAILNWITDERNLQGKNTLILPGKLEDSIKSKFLNLYKLWPEEIKSFCQKHISHIFIVKGLGSSGYTATKNDFDFYIFLDEKVLSEKPNDWFNRTEATGVDLKSENFSFNHIIEKESENYPTYTLENILIHEIGHCVGVVKGITPTFSGSISNLKNQKFFESCFFLDFNGRINMKPKYSILFENLKYYSDEDKISGKQYVHVLMNMKNSSFPTTYSTRSYLEYFAEYFYCYVHCHIQKKPCEYNVYKENKLYYSITHGLFNKASKDKFFLIEQVFKTL